MPNITWTRLFKTDGKSSNCIDIILWYRNVSVSVLAHKRKVLILKTETILISHHTELNENYNPSAKIYSI
jgi:hypothetical protein